MKRWYRKVRRRKPGIYAYRTRRHGYRGVEWGYAGKSNRLELRDGQHAAKQPWYDLVVRRYTLIRLPWWLGWDWVLLPLEAIVIGILRPRYNDKLNPRRDKVRKIEQARQRAQRDAGLVVPRVDVVGIAVYVVSFIMIIGGAAGWLITK